MDNDKICPETPIRVLLRAEEIPADANVTKRTGEQVYTLKRGLRLYSEDKAPVEITGLFLMGPRGSINQIKPETMLHWEISAEEFVEMLQRSWEIDQ